MKKVYFICMIALLTLLLAACGSRSQEEVVGDLEKKVEQMDGYKAEATMTLQMGTEPQEYNVEVWHQKENYYRVNLQNAQKDQNQMILRNDEGVFVLTPALNKSFRFQSEWPNNSSQAYLYESLVKDILEDGEATYEETDDTYVFTTKTRYQNNKMLPTQKITFAKKDLAPVKVEVLDTDQNPLVTVNFTSVEFDAQFEDGDFDVKKNMTGAREQLEVPVNAEVMDEEFTVLYPTQEIVGTELESEEKIEIEDGQRVILSYEGEKSYTLIQEKQTVVPSSAEVVTLTGNPVDLGFAVGAMTDQTIRWSYNGVEYLLASDSLTQEELAMVARSVQGDMVK
ncbi:LolA family protein [Bacillus fonticola]|uniref:LolA family protein n=1 Tax=Bacillus fonticola TaxID=2728853 RepID=UPI0014730094|nr:outer membrane lipoprotein carrier protein LolA [Bacillus fonticola]